MGKRIQRVDIDKMATKLLELGYQEENIHTEVQIDCTGVLWDYPDATVEMSVQAPNGEKYPVVPELSGNVVVWDVTDSDLVYAGSGKIQLTLKNGDEVIKSASCSTRIMESITATGSAPTPLENWMQQAEETAHQIALTAKDEVIEQIQDTAEEARESIPADYTQLSDDVTELKSAFANGLIDTIGFYNKNLFTAALKYNGKTIFTKNCTVTLNGDEYSIVPTAANPQFGNTLEEGSKLNPNLPQGYPIPCGGISELYFVISNDIFNRNYVTFYDNDYTSLGFTDYFGTNIFAVPVPEVAMYAVLRCGSNRTTVDVTYNFNVKCYDHASCNETVSKQISGINDSIDAFKTVPYQLNGGYISNNGRIVSPGEETKEVYTNEIPLDYGDTLKVVITLSETKSMWGVYVLYDENHNFISRINLIGIADGEYFERTITNTVTNARYVAISYRSYGISTMFIYSDDTLKILREEIPKTNLVHFINPIVKGINHRGYVSAPENTLPAFRLSRKKGFQYVETDVEFTSDGIPVLLHDATINRTARNADGTALSETVNIHDITYEQALTYDFGIYKGEEYAGTKIPTVEEFFALCRCLGLLPYVEFKNGTEYTQAQVESVVDIAKKYGMADKVSWISFSDVYLGYVKSYDEKARIGFICESPGDNQIAVILALRTDSNEVFADCHYSSINSTGAGKCIRNNIPLEAWTLNSKADLASLNPYVTGVTTDSLDIAQTLYWHGMQS